jgi:hypothetical protein
VYSAANYFKVGCNEDIYIPENIKVMKQSLELNALVPLLHFILLPERNRKRKYLQTELLSSYSVLNNVRQPTRE